MKYWAGYDPPVARTNCSAILVRSIEPVKELLIKGIRYDGSTFRPSDWAERLCGVAALLDSGAPAPIRAHHAARPGFHCSSHMRPAIICGVICVIVDLRLRELRSEPGISSRASRTITISSCSNIVNLSGAAWFRAQWNVNLAKTWLKPG
ncbi:Protein of unknown function [Nitrosospira multiformis]|uniref:DUF3579 domain-containing protein n=1 Tax=Nitrosospira multiformis TaxID=1231 RepID=A0A1H8B6F2_9PROT|nr:DUF3579 domain-containing protein [Nitrosospira multiformis]SEM78501.1 Protein of unknown function [Nitrosospira multiformis]